MIRFPLAAILFCVSVCAVGFCQEWVQNHKDDPLHGITYEEFSLTGKWVTAPQHGSLSAPILILNCQPGVYSWSLWDGTYREDPKGKRRGKLIEARISTGAVLDGTSSVAIEYRLDDQKLQRGDMALASDRTTAVFHHVDVYTLPLPKFLYGRDVWRKAGETYQAHRVLIGMPEYLGPEFVVQFDLPDVTKVADSCGLIDHKQ